MPAGTSSEEADAVASGGSVAVMSRSAENCVIRSPVPADAPAIGSVHYRCWVETYTGLVAASFWESVSQEGRIAMWQRILADPARAGDAVVAELDEEIIGFAMVGEALEHPSGHASVRERELYSIYVLAAHHGTGTGHRLLDAVLGDGPAQLWVADPNPRAQEFYRRHGFVPDGAVMEADPRFGRIREIRMVR